MAYNPDDQQYITVQIPESEVFGDSPPVYSASSSSGDADPSIVNTSKQGGWFKRHLSPDSKKGKEKTIGVRMTREEFLKYFAKDHRTGQYRKDVVEPKNGRQQWLQERIEEFSSGQLDEGAYEGNLKSDYTDLRKRSALGKAADFMGAPYTPEGMIPIAINKKKPSS